MAHANSVDPDQEHSVCHSIKYFKKQLHKKIRPKIYGVISVRKFRTFNILFLFLKICFFFASPEIIIIYSRQEGMQINIFHNCQLKASCRCYQKHLSSEMLLMSTTICIFIEKTKKYQDFLVEKKGLI